MPAGPRPSLRRAKVNYPKVPTSFWNDFNLPVTVPKGSEYFFISENKKTVSKILSLLQSRELTPAEMDLLDSGMVTLRELDTDLPNRLEEALDLAGTVSGRKQQSEILACIAHGFYDLGQIKRAVSITETMEDAFTRIVTLLGFYNGYGVFSFSGAEPDLTHIQLEKIVLKLKPEIDSLENAKDRKKAKMYFHRFLSPRSVYRTRKAA